MSDRPIYITIKDGKVVSKTESKLSNGTYVLKKFTPLRTEKQNRLYWGWDIPHYIKFHEVEFGEVLTKNEMHERLKETFLGEKRIYNKKKTHWVGVERSTTELTTKQFKDYRQKIKNWYTDNFSFCLEDPVTEDDLLYWESLIV